MAKLVISKVNVLTFGTTTRIFLIGLLLLSLVSPELFTENPALNIVVISDHSLSMDIDKAYQHLARLHAIVSDLTANSRITLRYFAKNLSSETTSLDFESDRFSELKNKAFYSGTSTLDRTRTNIESALIDTLPTYPGDRPTAAIVLTDGGQTQGDVDNLLSTINTSSTIFFDHINNYKAISDTSITRIVAPSRAKPGQIIPITVYAFSRLNTNGKLVIKTNGENIRYINVALKEGQVTPIRFWQRMTPNENALITTSIQIDNLTTAISNSRTAIVNLEAPPRVLYISEKQTDSVFLNSLKISGVNAFKVLPEHLLQHAHLFNSDTVVVLDNIAYHEMTEQAWRLLTDAVRHHGMGLIVLGGTKSFSAGAYRHSRLEDLLPVTAEAGKPEQKASVLFVVDKSGSMGQGSEDTRLSLARLAVLETSRSLMPHDRLGLLAFDINQQLLLPLNAYADPYAAFENVWELSASGGTRLKPALTAATKYLSAQDTVKQKILVLVTDGFTEKDNLEQETRAIAEKGITVIALAIGEEADMSALRLLTKPNNGKILSINKLANLPLLMRQEVEQQRHKLHRGKVNPVVVKRLPIFSVAQPPPLLSAYMVTKARKHADVYWRSETGDPLLASHHIGTGRVIALPAGLGKWAPQWQQWPHWNELVTGLVQWAHGRVNNKTEKIWLEEIQGKTQVQIETLDSSRDWANYQDIELVLRDPLNQITEIPLNYTAPGQYRAWLPLRHPGQYRLTALTEHHSLQHAFIYDEKEEYLSAFNGKDNINKWIQHENVMLWSVENFSALLQSLKQPVSARPVLLVLTLILYLMLIAYERGFLSMERYRVFFNITKALSLKPFASIIKLKSISK